MSLYLGFVEVEERFLLGRLAQARVRADTGAANNRKEERPQSVWFWS